MKLFAIVSFWIFVCSCTNRKAEIVERQKVLKTLIKANETVMKSYSITDMTSDSGMAAMQKTSRQLVDDKAEYDSLEMELKKY